MYCTHLRARDNRLLEPSTLPLHKPEGSVALKLVVVAATFLFALSTPAQAGFNDGVEAYERSDFVIAFHEFKTLAEAGIPAAQNKLGFLYESGRGVPQDNTEAVKWYRKAADQGDPEGQTNLGVMYLQGFGVARNPDEALRLFREAARQGYSMARTYRDLMSEGLGPVPEDGVSLSNGGMTKGETVFAHISPVSLSNGGMTPMVFLPSVFSPYYQRLGANSEWLLPPRIDSDATRLRYYCALAKNGDPIAQNNVGLMYAEGRGTDRDYATAYAWLAKALKKGNEGARTGRNLVAALMAH